MKQMRFVIIFQRNDYTAWFSLDGGLPVRVCMTGKKEEKYDDISFFDNVKMEMRCRVPQLKMVSEQYWYYTFLEKGDDVFCEQIRKSAEQYHVEYIPEKEIERDILRRNVPLALSEENYAKEMFSMTRWEYGAPDDKLLFVMDAGRSDHPVYVYELGESQKWNYRQLLTNLYLEDENCLSKSKERFDGFRQIKNQISEYRPWYWETDNSGKMHYTHLWYIGCPEDFFDQISEEKLRRALNCEVVGMERATVLFQKKDKKNWESGALLFLINEDNVEALFCMDENAEPGILRWPIGFGKLDQEILKNTLGREEENSVQYRRLLRECRTLRRQFLRKKQECSDFEEAETVSCIISEEVTGTEKIEICLSETLWDEIWGTWQNEWKCFVEKVAMEIGNYSQTTGVPLYIRGQKDDCFLAEEEICRVFERAIIQREIGIAGTVDPIADYALTSEYRKMFEDRYELTRSLRCLNEQEDIEDPICYTCRNIWLESVAKLEHVIAEKTEQFLTEALLESERPVLMSSTRYNRLRKKMESSLLEWIRKDGGMQIEKTDSLQTEILRISKTGQEKMSLFLNVLYGELLEGCEGFERKEEEQYFADILSELLYSCYFSEQTILGKNRTAVEERMMICWNQFLYHTICEDMPETVELPRKECWTNWKQTWKKDVSIDMRKLTDLKEADNAEDVLSQKIFELLDREKEEKLWLLGTLIGGKDGTAE